MPIPVCPAWPPATGLFLSFNQQFNAHHIFMSGTWAGCCRGFVTCHAVTWNRTRVWLCCGAPGGDSLLAARDLSWMEAGRPLRLKPSESQHAQRVATPPRPQRPWHGNPLAGSILSAAAPSRRRQCQWWCTWPLGMGVGWAGMAAGCTTDMTARPRDRPRMASSLRAANPPVVFRQLAAGPQPHLRRRSSLSRCKGAARSLAARPPRGAGTWHTQPPATRRRRRPGRSCCRSLRASPGGTLCTQIHTISNSRTSSSSSTNRNWHSSGPRQ